MTKIILRIVGTLLVLHGLVTFIAAKLLPLSAIGDRLLFAQHGFTFIFLALLNLAVWSSTVHGALFRWTVHISNLVFCLFYIAISLRKPEAPNYVSTVLVGALLLIALILDLTKKKANRSAASN